MSSKQADQQKQKGKDAAGPSKGALPALPKLPAGADVDTDSQADQQEEAPPQFGLMSKLQSVLDAADDDEEGDTGFEDLQVALQRVIKSKAAKQQQKQQAILQELQASFAAQQKALEATAAKDTKDVVMLATNSFNSLNKKLVEKYKHIEALNAKYQQDLHSSWEEYNEIYSQLEETKGNVLAVAGKRRTALKRKVTALQTSGREKLAEAEKKLQKISSQASKLPDLSNVLRAAFMA
eukprot:GHUV01002079.1.p1 GENE.GHUV01002079.1~~GHUV01002079.1.p1  ORF type:complete len:237 (+),score=108.60 GHUV01002079.1:397-1107(+)